jgi:tRNA-2-methylthio-N6-dimethylallyladenosine synthase
MEDDVPAKEKERRRKTLDEIQASVLSDINRQLLGKKVEVLVVGYQRDRWRGRTRTNKLVFFYFFRVWAGNLVDVEINWAGPWFMVGNLVRTD